MLKNKKISRNNKYNVVIVFSFSKLINIITDIHFKYHSLLHFSNVISLKLMISTRISKYKLEISTKKYKNILLILFINKLINIC